MRVTGWQPRQVAAVATTGTPLPTVQPWTVAATDALAQERAARELAEQRLADLKDILEEMRAQRDAWQAKAERLALPKPAVSVERKSLWRWLRTTG